MYQTEFAHRGSKTSKLQPTAHTAEIVGIVPLVWEEHCTECAFPTCYTTCHLYRERRDGHCARFADGIAASADPTAIGGYSAELTFGRWAKLEATLPRTIVRLTPNQARVAARLDRAAIRPIALVPRSQAPRVHLRYSDIRTRSVHRIGRSVVNPPDALVIGLWSHHEEPFQLFIETAGAGVSARTAVTIEPGANHATVSAETLGISNQRWPERIFVYPENDLAAHIVISTLDLAWLAPGFDLHSAHQSLEPTSSSHLADRVQTPAPNVKVLVWDLDNTLWNGTLLEDGYEGLKLREGVRELLEALDERGILLSIASKNDELPTLQALERFGVRDFFLVPEIHWSPKSASIRRISRSLDLGLDSFAFVDDSSFERGEVHSSLGAIRIYEPDDLDALLDRPEFNVPVTPEAKRRREMYRVEAGRKRELDNLEGDHDAFLRSCHLALHVFTPATPTEISRCVELLHRTNQLNLTTRRLSADEFTQMLHDSHIDVYGLGAEDRFGSYGIIGVAVVDSQGGAPVLTDFLTSCRIAQKTIENAWFEWLRNQLALDGATELSAVFVPTPRNHLLRSVLDEVGFMEHGTEVAVDPTGDVGSETIVLTLDLSSPVPRSSFVEVTGPPPLEPDASDEQNGR